MLFFGEFAYNANLDHFREMSKESATKKNSVCFKKWLNILFFFEGSSVEAAQLGFVLNGADLARAH